EGRVRVLTVEKMSWRYSLSDLNNRNLQITLRLPLSIPPNFMFESSSMVWADAIRTLFSNGAIYDSSARSYSFMRGTSNSNVITVARSMGQRGLVLGGLFKVASPTVVSSLMRLPDDGSIDSIRSVDTDNGVVSAIADTPMGTIAVLGRNRIAILGPDPSSPPTLVATLQGTGNCVQGNFDLASTGSSLVVGGCWGTITVGNTSTANRVVEIDFSSGSPVLAQTYAVGEIFPEQIAVTRKHVFVSSVTGQSALMALSRSTGRIVGRTPLFNYPYDMIAAPQGDRDILLLGGNNVGFGGDSGQSGPIMQMTVDAQFDGRFNFTIPSARINSVMAFATDSGIAEPTNPRYVYAGGIRSTRAANSPSIIKFDLSTGTVVPGPDLSVDNRIHDIAVRNDRLWVVGEFLTAVSNGTTHRASGVIGYDLAREAVFLRGAVPTPTTSTSSTVAPAGVPDDDAPTGEPVGPTPPPALPVSGEAGEGTYSVRSASGQLIEVRVLADGTLIIRPEIATIPEGTPFIVALVPGSRTVKVRWDAVPGNPVYKVSTGRGKGKRTCTTTRTSCTVKNLDPWKAHTFTVEAVRGRTRTISDFSPGVKPFVKVRKGSATKVSSIAPQGAKGRAKWTTRTPCSVKNGKLLVPKKAARCSLKVVVGKSTRTVNVRIG
ncbi:MAG: hypothetical protein ACKOQ7_04335, partial [Actinomycetota bacterium]